MPKNAQTNKNENWGPGTQLSDHQILRTQEIALRYGIFRQKSYIFELLFQPFALSFAFQTGDQPMHGHQNFHHNDMWPWGSHLLSKN